MQNTPITRLVTGFSRVERRLEQPARAGFVKAVGSGLSPFLRAATKPKASLAGFFMGGRNTPQSGLANGPTWAALKKHRTPRKGKPEETGVCRGPAWGGRATEPLNDSLNGDIGRQGRACGVHQPLSKSSGFDKGFSGIRLIEHEEKPGVSPNPCIRRPMVKTKRVVMSDPILHIWQQTGHHDDAYIYGNRDGLKVLKSLIEAALVGEPLEGQDLYQNDGEGYSIVIRAVSDAWVKLLPSAYTEFPDDNEDRQRAFIEVASGVAYQAEAK